jgi:F-type H+-transporting ATPase subunit b
MAKETYNKEHLNSETSHGSHHETPSLFKLDPGVGIWALVVFALLLFILRKFAWGPILASVSEREKTIRDSLEQAKQAQNESKKIAQEQNQILAEAKSEAATLIQNAKASAEEYAQKIKSDAAEEKQQTLDAGIKEIELAKQEAIRSLKQETGSIAIEIAEKLIHQSLDDAKHKELVDKLIEEIEIEK